MKRLTVPEILLALVAIMLAIWFAIQVALWLKEVGGFLLIRLMSST